VAKRLALAAVPCWLTLLFVTETGVPPELRAMVAIVAVVSIVYPTEGLCIVAAAVPLGDLIAIALESTPVRLTEALVVAFLAGWLLSPGRRTNRGPAPTGMVRDSALAFAVLILSSVAAVVLQMKAYAPTMWPGTFSRTLFEYFAAGPDMFGAIAGFRLIEGLGLATAVVLLLKRQPILAVWIPEALAAGCVMVVFAAYLLRYGVAFPAVMARYSLIGERIVAHVADINAAASYFALMLFVAAGVAVREAGRRRLWWAVVIACAVAGLWLSGSRSAMASVGVTTVCATLWWTSRRWHVATRYLVLTVCVIVLAFAALLPVMDTYFDATGHGARFRIEFTESSYRMIRSYPWLGLGIGQYYQASPMFLNGPLAWAYGSENAHNYFMQIAVETGLLGFAACVGLIAGMLGLIARAMTRSPGNYRLLGIGCGIVAFLLTCTTGHPFLTPEVVFPFWLAAGLAVALSAPTTPRVEAGTGRLGPGDHSGLRDRARGIRSGQSARGSARSAAWLRGRGPVRLGEGRRRTKLPLERGVRERLRRTRGAACGDTVSRTGAGGRDRRGGGHFDRREPPGALADRPRLDRRHGGSPVHALDGAGAADQHAIEPPAVTTRWTHGGNTDRRSESVRTLSRNSSCEHALFTKTRRTRSNLFSKKRSL
jgi:O-antigen ligase